MPTNDFPIISRSTNKKVLPIKNPRSYYAPEIPRVSRESTNVVLPKLSKRRTTNYTWLDDRIYNNVPQLEYPETPGAISRAVKAVVTGNRHTYDNEENDFVKGENHAYDKFGANTGAGAELFRISLGYSGDNKFISRSDYVPSSAKDNLASYYKINNLDKDQLLNDVGYEFKNKPDSVNSIIVPWGMVPTKDYKSSHGLGNFKISRGSDENGKYVSYYDKYDFDVPVVNGFLDRLPEVYDRVYYEDNPYYQKIQKYRKMQDSLQNTNINDNIQKSYKLYDNMNSVVDSANKNNVSYTSPYIQKEPDRLKKFFPESIKNYEGKIYADEGTLKKSYNPNYEYVSRGYMDRYPKLIKLTDDINPINQSLYNFSKVDSAYYTPTLDRLEKYANNINSTQLTDIQKNNLSIFSDSLNPFQYSDEERLARPYNIPEEQQVINKIVTNLTDQDITKLLSENYDDIKKMRFPGKISKAIKLAPSNASMKDLYQSVKFLNSDEGLNRFPNLYNTSGRISGVKAPGFMYGGKLKLINL